MKTITWITVYFLVVFTLPTFAQRPYEKNKVLEIDNLKVERNPIKPNGKIGEERVITRFVYYENFSGLTGDARDIALGYLKAKKEQFGIDEELNTIKVTDVKNTPGGSHVYYQQYIQDIPVYDSRGSVTIDKQGTVTFATNNYRPGLSMKSTLPSVYSSEAISIAKDYLNVTGKMRGKEKAELMIFESKDRGAELSWRINIPASQPLGSWEVFVNANDRRIIHVKDRMMYRTTNGRGMVWNPDPLTTADAYYGSPYVDNNDNDISELNAERISVTLKDITFDTNSRKYKLNGPYCVLSDEETPSDIFPELSDSSDFNYPRSQQEFEAVMVYYHIDKSTRRLIELGYNEPEQLQFKADPHGLSGDDNSHYDPVLNYVAFGEGNVDDAEDADVIWHEHAHSFQENFVPGGMSYSGETYSLQEGCSDYWAASYSRSLSGFEWGQLFIWDAGITSSGTGIFWPARRCDKDLKYSDLPIHIDWHHDDGQIWSSALMEIWGDIGRDITDILFLESHYIWGSSPELRDAASAFAMADINIYNGAHLDLITNHFSSHELLYSPTTSGTLSHNEVWYGTVNVTGNIIVPSGISLIIAPVVNVNFSTGTNLTVSGELCVMGNSANPAVLQSVTSAPNDWYGIYFNNGSSGYLQCCEINDSENMITVESGADVTMCDDNEVTLQPGFTVELGGEFYAYVDASLSGGLAQVASYSKQNSYEIVENDENTSEDDAQTEQNKLPANYSLSPNYPNPFNPTTTFKYTLKEETKVTIKVYNILGKEIITLVNRTQPAGYQSITWNGTDHSGNPVPSGIYICQMKAGNFTKSQKMVLMK